MNIYFYELLMKERQHQIAEDFKRIHLARAKRKAGFGCLKKGIRRFGEVLLAVRVRLGERYQLSGIPVMRNPDSCSTL